MPGDASGKEGRSVCESAVRSTLKIDKTLDASGSKLVGCKIGGNSGGGVKISGIDDGQVVAGREGIEWVNLVGERGATERVGCAMCVCVSR